MNPLYTITEYTGFHLLDDANYPILLTKSEDYYDLLADAVLYTQSIMHASLDLYGHRVKFDRKQILYQFLGEAGIDDKILIRLIRSNAKGLPPGVNEESVRRYWNKIGPDSTKLLASSRRQYSNHIERDYDISIDDLLPNQSITIDVFDAAFSKSKNSAGRLETILLSMLISR